MCVIATYMGRVEAAVADKCFGDPPHWGKNISHDVYSMEFIFIKNYF